MDQYINMSKENIASEHLCCAIADKKHQCGVQEKKHWLMERFPEGHIFRKLDAKAKVFIEYAPLETAWVPIDGDGFLYIYCLWVSGSYKGKGYGKALLEYCIDDAKSKNKSGICALAGKKKSPFLSDKKFLEKHGFSVCGEVGDYVLMYLSFDASKPRLRDTAHAMAISDDRLTIYYGKQCPYIPNCVEQVEKYCQDKQIPYDLISIDSLEKAKDMPGVFNNWAVFYKGKFSTVHILNEGFLDKLLKKEK